MTLKYSHAIVARISNSLRSNGLFDLELAKEQHRNYCNLLREVGLDVIELPPDESLPESVFVESSVVICNGVALICKSTNPLRQQEADSLALILRKELDVPVEIIDDPEAQLHGGDVLFTGREFFVGISEVTNEAGARAVAVTFPDYPVTPIKVGGLKCLKYYVSMAGPDILSVSNSSTCQQIVKLMEREASHKYQKITLSEEHATNMLYVNGTLIHRSPKEIQHSYKIIKEKLDLPTRNIDISEFGQFSNGLSSCCVLLRRWKSIRSL